MAYVAARDGGKSLHAGCETKWRWRTKLSYKINIMGFLSDWESEIQELLFLMLSKTDCVLNKRKQCTDTKWGI